MNIRPLHDRVVVKREPQEQVLPAASSSPIPQVKSRPLAK